MPPCLIDGKGGVNANFFTRALLAIISVAFNAN